MGHELHRVEIDGTENEEAFKDFVNAIRRELPAAGWRIIWATYRIRRVGRWIAGRNR